MNNRQLLRPMMGLFLITSVHQAQAAATLHYLQLTGGWPRATIRAGADWSSDLGVDYVMGVGDNESLVPWGDGAANFSRPLGNADSDFWLDYRLNSRGGAAGDTYSGGKISMGKSGNLDQAAPTKVSLYNNLGANSGGYGISTYTYARDLYHVITPDFAYQKIYFAFDYTIRVETDGYTDQAVYFRGPNFQGHDLLKRTVRNGSSDTISGTILGEVNGYWYFQGATSYSQFSLETYLGDVSGSAGAGILAVDGQIRYGTSPLTPVPEPATMTVLALGALALIRKKRRA